MDIHRALICFVKSRDFVELLGHNNIFRKWLFGTRP